ncbi:MAG: amidohydrolase [Fusobacteriaceae bacterium]|jgi:amidohydrolase|nr:amidohydrolase [Fusobacteriaceae bacterium]
MTDIGKLAGVAKDYIIERRRWYHSHPELSFKEEKTTEAIISDLKALGITEITPMTGGWYGCVGVIEGRKEGPTVLLRADIDALPVTEESGLPYASQNPGVMHACGHDTHIAMLLGAAKILQSVRAELPGRVKLLFQPAEEFVSGAKEVIRQGFLDDVNACYGVHINSVLPSGAFDFCEGERMAAGDGLKITVEGMSAHGSAPHLGHDAIVAAGAIIGGVQAVVSRFNNPLSPLVVTLGTIHGGQRANIIPQKVVMEGTVRYFDRNLMTKVIDEIKQVTENMAAAYGCAGSVEYRHGVDPLSNTDKRLVELARGAVTKLFGKDKLIDLEKNTGGEDFSFYMDKVPGVFGNVGARSDAIPESALSLHHEKFSPDEEALAKGAAVAAQFAVDYLAAGK